MPPRAAMAWRTSCSGSPPVVTTMSGGMTGELVGDTAVNVGSGGVSVGSGIVMGVVAGVSVAGAADGSKA